MRASQWPAAAIDLRTRRRRVWKHCSGIRECPNARGNGHDLFLQLLAGEHKEPPHATPAHGSIVFRLTQNAASDAIDYVPVADQITNVVAAHFHIGSPGVNGPVVEQKEGKEGKGEQAKGCETNGVSVVSFQRASYQRSAEKELASTHWSEPLAKAEG